MGKSRSKPAVGAARIIKSLIAEGMIAKFQRRGSVSCTELCVPYVMFRPRCQGCQSSATQWAACPCLGDTRDRAPGAAGETGI